MPIIHARDSLKGSLAPLASGVERFRGRLRRGRYSRAIGEAAAARRRKCDTRPSMAVPHRIKKVYMLRATFYLPSESKSSTLIINIINH